MTGQYRFETEAAAKEWKESYDGTDTLKGPYHRPSQFGNIQQMGAALDNADPKPHQ